MTNTNTTANTNTSAWYLFYSQNYCEHSKRIISLLTKYDTINNFTLCNVDNPELIIPPFITTVPTLYLATERQLLKDNDLFQWIDNHNKTLNNNKTISMQDITGSADILAYTDSELGSANGPAYSFIDDGSNDLIASSFEMLDGSNKNKVTIPTFTRIDAIQQSDNDGPPGVNRDQRKNELDKAYDELMRSRSVENNNNPIQQRM